MVAKRWLLILKIIIVLFSILFLILFSSNLIDVITGNIEGRIFNMDSSAESFIFRSKIVYVVYTIIELIFLIPLLLLAFLRMVPVRYLMMLLFANIILILLPLIIIK